MKQPRTTRFSTQEPQLWMRQLTALNRIERIATEDLSLCSVMQKLVGEVAVSGNTIDLPDI